MSLNQELADLFARFASLMDLKGAAVFKAIAFNKVSRILEDLTSDVRQLHEAGELKGLAGVGESSRAIIEDYLATGRSKDYDEVAATVPPGLMGMLAINGLGPKTVRLLWNERGITSIDELSAAIDAGKLEGLAGIGAKKIESIKQGIALRQSAAGRVGIGEAIKIAGPMLEAVRALPGVARAEVAGSLRRGRETIGDVDIICALREPGSATAGDATAGDATAGDATAGDAKAVHAKAGHATTGDATARDAQSGDVAAGDAEAAKAGAGRAASGAGEAVTKAFSELPGVTRVLGQGVTKASVLVEGGMQVDLRVVPLANFGAAMLYFTGSKDHNVRLRGMANDHGWTLNEWGIFPAAEFEGLKRKPGEPPTMAALASESEAAVYKQLGLAFIAPELREARDEVERASTGRLPKLIEIGDIRGDLHTHTHASDGHNSIEEMVEAARARGYGFLGITDHSKSQTIANGLTKDRLLKHAAAIRKVAGQLKGFTLLAGCEVDILADGSMDFEDAVLAELDFVVGSPHVALKQDQEKATARLLRAIENKFVTIIGHPTGRLINTRAGLPLDFAKVFAAAAASGTVLEINAGYPRLDLNDLHARAALEAGCVLTINTDAHSTQGLGGMGLGITVARRAGAEAKDVINTFTPAKLAKVLGAKRG